MPKESNNLGSKKTRSSKPYDVANSSFVQRATSRVLDFLPQTTWLSRWLAPSSEADFIPAVHSPESVRLITTRSDLNAVNSTVETVSRKRPEVHVISSFDSPSNLIASKACVGMENEELSPITSLNVASTSKLHSTFTFSSLPASTSQVNGGDDCSETSESTSGCSSLLPQAQSTINQRIHDLNTTGHSRSILPNTNNLSLSYYRSSMHGRKPSFNTSTFSATSRGSGLDRGGSSPFYSGRTMFGGASANSIVNCLSTRRLGPTVRPVKSKHEQIPLSSTAKKILDALEQFSTPILDAKRIPVTVGTKRRATGANSSKRFTELNVPTTTDLLRVKRRERLQKSTFDARQTSETSIYSNTDNLVTNSTESECILSEPEFSQYNNDKNPGKLKTRWKERPQAREKQDEVVDLKLPNVKLPLTSLPSIDIKISSQPSKNSIATENSNFLFSLPLQDKCSVSKVCTKPTVNFKFSNPFSDTKDSESVLNVNVVCNSKSAISELKTKSEHSPSDDDKRFTIQPTAHLETGSVMDVLGAHKRINTDSISTKSADLWKCEKCFLNHSKTVLQCVGCKEEKLSTDKKDSSPLSNLQTFSSCEKVETSVSGFGDKFKKPLDSWECGICLVINGKDLTKCLSCGNDKGGNKEENPTTKANLGFGDKFKPSAGSWECKSCLIMNKVELTKCAACETPMLPNDVKKPILTPSISSAEGFGNSFKNAPGTWECNTCLIRNNSDKIKCVACETPKPGVKISETKEKQTAIGQFSFGIPKGMDNLSGGFKFGELNTESDSSKATTFNFGIANTNKPENSNSTKATPTFQFGLSNQVIPVTSSSVSFTFGMPKNDSANLLINGSNNNKTDQSQSSGNTFNTTAKIEERFSTGSNASDQIKPTLQNNELKKLDLISSTPKSSSSNSTSVFTFGSSNISTTSKINKQSEESKTTQFQDSSASATKPAQTVLLQNSMFGLNSFSNTKTEPSVSVKESKPITFNANKSNLSSISGYQSTTSPATLGSSATPTNQPTIGFGSQSSTFAPIVPKEQSPNNFVAQNIFSQNDSSTVQKPVANVFGSAASTTPFSGFGVPVESTVMTEDKPAALFTFNKPAEQPTGFGFASGQPTNSGFMFNTVQPSNSEFNFTTKAETKTPSFPSTVTNFGTSVFGGLQQPTSTPTPSSVFAFGSGSQSTNSVFGGFGTSQNSIPQVPTPSPAFVFGATPVPSQVPAFDPNAKPTFNFTGGAQPSTFTATPSAPLPSVQNPQRKIRKAVRRQTARPN